MAKLPSGPLADVDAEFERMALETGGATFGLSGTSAREKLLQVTAHDICLANVGLAFKMHIQAMNMHGVSYGDMLALIRFVAPYAGYPAAASSLEALRRYGAELGLKVAADVDPERSGEERAEAVVPVADQWLGEFLASRLGRAWTEDRLSARERAFVALTAHVTLGELGPSFRRHVKLALAAASVDEVRDAVRFTGEMGVTRAVAALEALEAVLAAQG
ncbi:hypothetical protein ABGB14_44935 [Nonomuraea sp. B10E15]|uniref:hypothetical protein n=1 Tax=Nonomuraea sp. B10E15 TaxID=3153560 RepID=UPI00325CA342